MQAAALFFGMGMIVLALNVKGVNFIGGHLLATVGAFCGGVFCLIKAFRRKPGEEKPEPAERLAWISGFLGLLTEALFLMHWPGATWAMLLFGCFLVASCIVAFLPSKP